jgi:hypothetical protein
MAGTVEVYVISAIFLSFWRNVSRISGDRRGEGVAQGLEDRIDVSLGMRQHIDSQFAAAKQNRNELAENAHQERTAIGDLAAADREEKAK